MVCANSGRGKLSRTGRHFTGKRRQFSRMTPLFVSGRLQTQVLQVLYIVLQRKKSAPPGLPAPLSQQFTKSLCHASTHPFAFYSVDRFQ